MKPKQDTPAPIVIKRIKKGGHAHHGGAWKIAYADFVTAMMAFFLLMWLLGSTTEGDLKGIADYFNSPLKVGMNGGTGSGDSSHLIKGGGGALSRSTGQVEKSKIDDASGRRTINLRAAQAEIESARVELARAEGELLKGLKDKVEAMMSAQQSLADIREQIKLEITQEGLRIQLVDTHNRPMFDSGSAVLKPYSRSLLREIGRLLNDVPQRLSIYGHTDATPFPGSERGGYGNWELSADRSNAARREMTGAGLDDQKVLRVIGVGASLPLNTKDPFDPINRRITIIVMNSEATRAVMQESGTLQVSEPESAARGMSGALRQGTN